MTESNAHRVFTHLTADHCARYRTILRVFVEAKAAFVLHLRPAEVRDAITERLQVPCPAVDEIEAALVQLREWGNLEAHRDSVEVATVEAFLRQRYLYQLSREGEAAERALTVFDEALIEPGELQSQALEDIRQYIAVLQTLAAAPILDGEKVVETLELLRLRFENLTARAQSFMRGLQRAIELRGIELDAFIAYKTKLIEHLERFVEVLVLNTGQIAECINDIEATGLARLLAAAVEREFADALLKTAERRLEIEQQWERRWNGFRTWFIGRRGQRSQAETLRARARSAVPAFLAAVAGINERRLNRSDRTADLQALARWFAEAESDEDAHRLWRAAFALSPTRHLAVDQETLAAREQNPVPPQRSWLEAEPVMISPRLRKIGRAGGKGPVRQIIDCSRAKAELAKLAHDEAAQLAAAQAQLAQGRPIRLSDLGALDPAAFDLFLDLLGEVLSSRADPRQAAEADSSDGSLRVRLEPAEPGTCAVITTSHGSFSGEDCFVTITWNFPELAA